jgi:raffinose/stachyose/melibiose transport system permease protein
MSKKLLITLISNLIAWIISIISLVPFLLILFNSLKISTKAAEMNLKLPDFPLQLINFSVVIEKGKLVTSFLNSSIYTIGSVFVCCILSSLAAYVLSRNRTKLTKVIYLFIVLGITMPINYVALMKVMLFLNLHNTQLGIILLYSAMQIPFSVFLLYSFIAKIPVDLDEAGIIDGCSPIRLFITIVFPLLKPAIATVVVLCFLNNWNEFISPLYFLSSSTKWPMTLSVYNFFGMYFRDWNLVCADIVMTSIPVIIIYLFGQKYIVSGMTTGAVKG